MPESFIPIWLTLDIKDQEDKYESIRYQYRKF